MNIYSKDKSQGDTCIQDRPLSNWGGFTKAISGIGILFLAIGLLSCEEFLDAKPSKSLVIPSTYSELDGLLNDNSLGMNRDPGTGPMAVDDIELTQSALLQINQKERNAYLWDADPNLEAFSGEWSTLYKQVYNANMVLDCIGELEEGSKKGHLEGKAQFVKGQAYFYLLQEFCLPYRAETAGEELGIPLRNTVDVNELTQRSSLEESYAEVEKLLLRSAELMEEMDISRKTPSKWAAFALLSRFYLIKGDFQQSLEFADEALTIGNELLDYNVLDTASLNPFPEFGTENIYNVTLSLRGFWTSSGTGVLPELYASYDSADLRKYLFFRKSPEQVMVFKGSYTGNYELFGGLATDELYLNKAESHARLGEDEAASATMDALLVKRYAAGEYSGLAVDENESLLERILEERRKELVFRNIRWFDLRRFSVEDELAVSLSREFEGREYSLDPGSTQYAFPIPMDELRLNGLKQNEGY